MVHTLMANMAKAYVPRAYIVVARVAFLGACHLDEHVVRPVRRAPKELELLRELLMLGLHT